MKELDKAYNPKEWEGKIRERWEKSGFANPDTCIQASVTKTDAAPFSVLMPPPNVTGVLHLGHAMENAIMDIMARYQRMHGHPTLFLPGADHAAVATQAKVEKILIEKEGLKNPRIELGREKLLDKIRAFADESKKTIIEQVKSLGSSCDWSRFAYTFDEKRALAVTTVFKSMYEDGLIYRGHRVVNWSVKGQSTASDDELVYVERSTTLYTFRYTKDFPIAIASTRPETKLGDSAVAVHPSDERYKDLIGKTYTVDIGAKAPLEIKIIGDESVDPEFGTGAVGVTPAHSQVDFEMYERHKGIKLIQVIGADGKMTAEAGSYAGLSIEEAREKFVIWLRENNLIEKEEEITHNVGTSDRFGDVVEVLPMTQWFVDVNKEIPDRGKSLKDLMRDAVTSGINGEKVNIEPERFTKVYLHWIDNLRDWCISRQIWWGHRIPVWYCLGCGKERVDASVKSHWFLVRHGETDWNVQERVQGSSDQPLNDNGREQAKTAASFLSHYKIDALFSSDLIRAKETAEIIRREIGGELIFDKRLRERHGGKLEGMIISEVHKLFPAFYSYYEKVHEAEHESYGEIEERIWEAISEHQKNHLDKNIVVVSHGAILRTLLRRIKNVDPESFLQIKRVKNAEPIQLDILDSPCDKCGGHFYEQDSDTLDTWFSSGLWTFSTLGWPEKTKDLETFHPTTFMTMGYEILFFWMARMILMTSYALKTVPFKDVYIHGMLRDKDGRKFSKSLGNGIEPLDVIEKYGTDALRYALISDITPGNDSRFSYEKVENARNLVNKIWNIGKYVTTQGNEEGNLISTPSDGWIMSRLDETLRSIDGLMKKKQFSLALGVLYDFTWSDFADWYVEIHKVTKNNSTLHKVYEILLRAWHPFLPFVTEVLYLNLKKENELPLMVQPYPISSEISKDEYNLATVQEFVRIIDLIKKIRNVRALYHIDPKEKLALTLIAPDSFGTYAPLIERLARIEKVTVEQSATQPPKTARVLVNDLTAFVHLGATIDVEKERSRLNKEKENLEQYKSGIKKRLSDEKFTKNAPEHIIAQNNESLTETEKKIDELSESLQNLAT